MKRLALLGFAEGLARHDIAPTVLLKQKIDYFTQACSQPAPPTSKPALILFALIIWVP
jgi:hypothetical protein